MDEICLRTTSHDQSLWVGDQCVKMDWDDLWRSVHHLMEALSGGLSDNQFPTAAANDLAQRIAPPRSGDPLVHLLTGKGRLRLSSDPEAAALPLELLPLEDGGWLDLKQPIYRVLTTREGFHFEVQTVPHRRSVALLYQFDSEEVKQLVSSELFPFLESLDLRVDCFTAGELFPGGAQANDEIIRTIFREYSAVVFIGNGSHTRLGQSKGWVMDGRRGFVLTVEDIHKAFALSRDALRRERHTVCDLVFSNSCCSAVVPPRPSSRSLAPERASKSIESFPELFQALGVRHYVGTISEVLVRPDITLQLLSNFFTHWAAAPEGVVEHLFAAKQTVRDHDGRPHVQTALYQVFQDSREAVPYAAELNRTLRTEEPEIINPAVEGGEERHIELPPMLAARGPVVGLVQTADVLLTNGQRWVLGEPLADDVCGRWYRASARSVSCLVQVLADELRDNLPQDLEAVMLRTIEQLAALNLGRWHLCPTKFGFGVLCRSGVDTTLAASVPVLFYEREDVAEEWLSLAGKEWGRDCQPIDDFLRRVLDWGHDAARRLEELHSSGFAHGNVFPGSFMVRRGSDAGPNGTLVLKDAWLALALGRRLVPRRYAAPDSWQGRATPAVDVHGLGLVLYELACGVEAFGESSLLSGLPEPMSRVLGKAAPEVEGLERCVRDCLVPDERLRPSAAVLCKRLFICWTMGGSYLSDFASAVHHTVQAERRLLVVGNAVEPGEVWRSLITLTAGDQPVLPPNSSKDGVKYDLYVIREGEGMSRWNCDLVAEERMRPWQTIGLPNLDGPLNSDQVALLNAAQFFHGLSEVENPRHAIVLIEGAGWWAGQLGQLGARLLREAINHGGPVVIIADAIAELHEELLWEAVHVRFPDPSRAVIYEEVMKFCAAHGQQLEVDDAVSVALRLAQAGCTLKEVRLCLRLCWLAHAVVDTRAGGMLEEQRARRLVQPGLHVVPVSRLPHPRDFYMTPLLAKRVDDWVAAVQARAGTDIPLPVPATMGIFGEPGAGRSSLVRHLAARLGWQLAQLRPGRCVGRELGSAERTIRQVLSVLSSAGPAVVLIEADEEWPAHLPPEPGPALRVLAIVVEWIKNLPRHLVLAVVCASETGMPRELAGAIQARMPTLPSRCDGDALAGLLGTLFHRHALHELASETSFLDQLVAALMQSQRRAWIPEAGLIGPVQALRHTCPLMTAADISFWFEETLLVHAAHASLVQDRSFWLRRFDFSTPLP